MDYDVIYVDDERNAVRVSDHRTPGGDRRGAGRPRPLAHGGRSAGRAPDGDHRREQLGRLLPAEHYAAAAAAVQGESFASRFGMTTGELIDTGIQLLAAIQPLPAAPTAQGEAGVDVENLITYQGALWQHAKRDEQLRTLGGLLARILQVTEASPWSSSTRNSPRTRVRRVAKVAAYAAGGDERALGPVRLAVR